MYPGHNGTVPESFVFQTEPGIAGAALVFDESASHIPVDDAELFDGQSALSISFWIKQAQFSDDSQAMLSKGVVGGSVSYIIYLNTDNKLCAQIGGESSVFQGITELELNTWYHLVFRFDGSQQPEDRVALFVNGGKESLSTACTAIELSDVEGPLMFGAENDGFEGTVDEVKLYERILSVDEIYGIYAERMLDTDNDGLLAYEEDRLGTDSGKADTDGDGMSDGDEIAYNFNPLFQDGSDDDDGDGLTNAQELNITKTNPQDEDYDNDLLLDGWEYANGTDIKHDDASDDPDSDTLTNYQEMQYGSNPYLADTDGDGMNDNLEVARGKNPAIPNYWYDMLIIDLPLSQNGRIELTSVNNAGDVAGYVAVSLPLTQNYSFQDYIDDLVAGTVEPPIWKGFVYDGEFSMIDPIQDRSRVLCRKINDDGSVIGIAYNSQANGLLLDSVPFIYRESAVIPYTGYASDADVVDILSYIDESVGCGYSAVSERYMSGFHARYECTDERIYTCHNEVFSEMPAPSDGIFYPKDMNSDGVMVGYVENDGGESYACTYQQGVYTPIAIPGIYTSSEARFINEHGVISGTCIDANGYSHVFWVSTDGQVHILFEMVYADLPSRSDGDFVLSLSNDGIMLLNGDNGLVLSGIGLYDTHASSFTLLPQIGDFWRPSDINENEVVIGSVDYGIDPNTRIPVSSSFIYQNGMIDDLKSLLCKRICSSWI